MLSRIKSGGKRVVELNMAAIAIFIILGTLGNDDLLVRSARKSVAPNFLFTYSQLFFQAFIGRRNNIGPQYS
jgi:hypothetical protein